MLLETTELLEGADGLNDVLKPLQTLFDMLFKSFKLWPCCRLKEDLLWP